MSQVFVIYTQFVQIILSIKRPSAPIKEF